MALTITVTGAGGGAPPSGTIVHVSGAVSTDVPCGSGTCIVPGTAGTYTLRLEAPGFASVERTVTVHGTSPTCGCPTADTEVVKLSLAGPGAQSIVNGTRRIVVAEALRSWTTTRSS